MSQPPLIRQAYYPKDDDYYIILDVDFNATQETIVSAYRNLAKRYHPDKNTDDERSQREAEVIFQKVKTAYDVLSDPRKRKIYDTLGPDGLKLDGWRLVSKQMTAEEIRQEFMRLQKQQQNEKIAIVAKPRASFTMALDASEIFRRTDGDTLDEDLDSDEGEDAYYASLGEQIVSPFTKIEIRSLSTSMAIDNNLALNHTLTLTGNLNTQNGVGEGMMGAVYRYKYSPDTQYSLLYQVGRGPICSLGVDHKLNDKTSVSCRGMMIFDNTYIIGACKLTLTHKIRNYLLGKVAYREGVNSSVTTSLIYINEELMLEVTTSYKLTRLHQSVSIDLGYKFNNDKSKLSVSMLASEKDGLAVEYGCETRVFTLNVVGASLSLSLPSGITLKLRFNRANQEFVVPIYLSDEVHSAPMFYGTMVPLIAFYIVDRCYLRHQKESQ